MDTPRKSLRLGLSLMPSEDFIASTYELFEAGLVDVLEWSFDMGFTRTLPDWTQGLLSHYSEQNGLLGHGVTLSLFSPDWQARQDQWLEHLHKETTTHTYLQISEHFGFMTSPSFHDGSPMPLPDCPEALALAKDRLQFFQSHCPCPVGLENLALAFSRDEAFGQGRFLGELLKAADAFLVLDIHNLYCLTENFAVDPFELLTSYPLDRVRELHISGGSWLERPGRRRLRRDTHDGAVPSELFNWLPKLIERCPSLEFIILERIEGTLLSPQDQAQFRGDFHRIRDILIEAEKKGPRS